MKVDLTDNDLDIIADALFHYELICMKHYMKKAMKQVNKVEDKILKAQGVIK